MSDIIGEVRSIFIAHSINREFLCARWKIKGAKMNRKNAHNMQKIQ